jgi:hypothetical protein
MSKKEIGNGKKSLLTIPESIPFKPRHLEFKGKFRLSQSERKTTRIAREAGRMLLDIFIEQFVRRF